MDYETNISGYELVDHLARRCRADQRSRTPNSESCIHLFKLALADSNQAAWLAICMEFSSMVYAWVYAYPSFQQANEEASYFVNDAFARLWQYGSPLAQGKQFIHLGDYLQYLKRCVWSALEDHQRKLQKDALWQRVYPDSRMLEMEKLAQPQPDNRSPDTHELVKLVRELTQENPLERIVAEETWFYDLPPRSIQERHSAQFATIAEVNQVKRNILRRLQRHPKIQAMINS